MAQYLFFHKIEDNNVIDHCDIFKESTLSINWCRKCLQELGGTDVKYADRRVVFEHKCGFLCKNYNAERNPGNHSPPKKRCIARNEPSCS